MTGPHSDDLRERGEPRHPLAVSARLRVQFQEKTLVAGEREGPDPPRLVFIDETWRKTNMAPLRGWASKGERLPGAAPFGHRNTSTFIAARALTGSTRPGCSTAW